MSHTTRAVFYSSLDLEAGPSRTTGVPVAIAPTGLQYGYVPLRKLQSPVTHVPGEAQARPPTGWRKFSERNEDAMRS